MQDWNLNEQEGRISHFQNFNIGHRTESISEPAIGKQQNIETQGFLHQSFNKNHPTGRRNVR